MTADLIITLATIKISAKLSLRLLLLRKSTERRLSCDQLNWILLHAAYQTLKQSKLQQLSAQQQISQNY